MHQIICDRCQRECTGTHGQLHLTRTQSTAQREIVAEDQFTPLDLCDFCTEIARAAWGFKIMSYEKLAMPQPEVAGWGPSIEIRGEDVPADTIPGRSGG